MKDAFEWGVVSYPMRYEPLSSRKKNKHTGNNWTKEDLDLVAKARRVLGYGGAFPPYSRLVEKIEKAEDFNEAFELWPMNWHLQG